MPYIHPYRTHPVQVSAECGPLYDRKWRKTSAGQPGFTVLQYNILVSPHRFTRPASLLHPQTSAPAPRVGTSVRHLRAPVNNRRGLAHALELDCSRLGFGGWLIVTRFNRPRAFRSAPRKRRRSMPRGKTRACEFATARPPTARHPASELNPEHASFAAARLGWSCRRHIPGPTPAPGPTSPSRHLSLVQPPRHSPSRSYGGFDSVPNPEKVFDFSKRRCVSVSPRPHTHTPLPSRFSSSHLAGCRCCTPAVLLSATAAWAALCPVI